MLSSVDSRAMHITRHGADGDAAEGGEEDGGCGGGSDHVTCELQRREAPPVRRRVHIRAGARPTTQ